MNMSRKKKAMQTAAAVTLALSLTLPVVGPISADSAQQAASLAPIRQIATDLGASVKWNPKDRQVIVKKDALVLILTIGGKTALLNGEPIQLPHPVRLKDGNALADSQFLVQILSQTAQAADPADLFLAALKKGNGDKAAGMISKSSAYAFPAPLLNQIWANYESLFGKVTEQSAKQETKNNVHRNVTYTFQTDKVPFQITLRLNTSGQIDDAFVTTVAASYSASTYQKPSYDVPGLYTEQEVTVGQGDWALPGTLTLPSGKEHAGPFPVVVLVHGSGTHDQDSTIGGGKPFRDLAVGLASQGIAVLRYNKVTYEHTFKVAADPKFTLKRETVDDALEAVKLLKSLPNIDSSKIFVAGHSQGGYAIPMIVDADKDGAIAGTIVISGPSGKFADVLALQQKELVSRVKKLGVDSAPYEQQAAQWTAISAMVNDPQYTVDNMPAQFPLQPAYWWFERKNYIPAETAKEQTVPMLILQGENDWQVPVVQFEGWKTALKQRKDVEFKSYPKVNHLLAEHDELSIGNEYYQPSNVSKAIVDDIANWVKKTK